MSLQIKNLDVAGEVFLVAWSPKLFEVYCDWCKIVNNPEITCGYEKRNYPSTHSTIPLRAFDGNSKKYERPEIIMEAINDEWEYDYKRPEMNVCEWHENRDAPGCHFHFQVHTHTHRRNHES